MTCTSWYKLVQACTSSKKFFVKILMQERSPMDVCKVSCVVSPSSVGMSTQLPLESGASSQGLSKLREGRMSCPRGGDTTIQRGGKRN